MLTDDESTPTQQELASEAALEGKDSKTRHLILWGGLALVLFVVLSLASWGYIWYMQVQAGSNLASQVTVACKDGTLAPKDDLCTQAKAVEKVVEEGPPGPVGGEGQQGKKGDTGERGPGPTAAQVNQAVATWCSGGRCIGKPTTAQVLAAVTTICANGACDGPPGTDGTNGTDGNDGVDGQNATPEQIATAVAAYCADDNCRGAKGDKGDKGEPGTSAYPFSFTFTIPSRNPINPDRTYECQMTEPGTVEECILTEETTGGGTP